MSKRLFVGNLSFSLNSQELEAAFGQVGEVVSVRIILDRESGQSKGFGFVEMADEEAGAKAIEKLNGKDVDGRPIKITEATPEQDRPVGGNRFGGQRTGGFSRGGRKP
jgi:cold-inducible RNA-binding protein